ncbi:hypothetical protein LO739_00285 [Leclercia adecarboxylata]|uniref:hypothetical protein n=1 Tax=Leclercia adecarboxylata TaxID=83655 RepID=UPI000744B12F|nr:hypothetical protein [Leclercia adecarboxylata]ALZ98505.1 hypothetical protein APT61_21800 [Leclercia adecarboxylata]UFM69672.1 hypothetical protein LO739_00285 [Leclercia adecarboxylata]HCC74763.1 hypothetical protein [Shigella sp.]
MSILFNERSLNNNLKSSEELFEQIKSIMKARQFLLKEDLHIYCNRNFINLRLSNNEPLQKYINKFDKTEKLDILNWLSKSGPFWDDEQLHTADEVYLHGDEKVTGSALAEAAAQLYCGDVYDIFSLENKNYLEDNLTITLKQNDNHLNFIIKNHKSTESLQDKIKSSEKSIESWLQLEHIAKRKYQHLEFISDCFSPLHKMPFFKAASISIMEKLSILDKIKTCFDSTGKFNREGNELNQNHFVGQKAWFSDSSEGEKIDFANEMTFEIKKDDIRFCPWHGKIKTPQIRIHFTHPIEQQSPLYIVYIGEKITKR